MAFVRLDYSGNWHVKHLRSIETAYRRAPFFEHYIHHIEPLFNTKFFLLSEFNLEALHRVLNCLKLKTKITLDTGYMQSLDLPLSSSEKPYFQVFTERHGFIKDLSILDLIFNEGPSALDFI